MVRAYSFLEGHFRDLGLFSSAQGILYWDCATMMPSAASGDRAKQLALLGELHQRMAQDSRIAEWIEEAEQHIDGLNPWQRANLREMTRQWRRVHDVPPRLVAALTEATVQCESAWRQARRDNCFDHVAPYLEKVVAYVIEVASIHADRLGLADAYDALLDEHEAGLTSEYVDSFFEPLEAFLHDFIPQVEEEQKHAPPLPFTDVIDIDRQKDFVRSMMACVGFDKARGRLDESAHPFCGGSENDVRITVRYDSGGFFSALMAVLHESGHALYEQGLPSRWHYQPVAQARGSAWHESQALITEMQAARSMPFITYLTQALREQGMINKNDPAWQADNVYKTSCRLRPNAARVDADEVTYPLHIILRYRIEKALIGQTSTVRELPELWRSHSQRILSVPETDSQGCLQDIHWFEGMFGYFPCYTLGAMIAAQLYGVARRDSPTIERALQQGSFKPLQQWLHKHVHRHGSYYSSDQLLSKACNAPLTLEPFMAHLRQRYAPSAATSAS